MRLLRSIGIVGIMMILAATRPAAGAISGLERVASDLTSPMFVTHAPGDNDRLFIGLRDGTVRILDLNTNTLLGTPFISINDVEEEGEGGLLGMAFHPDYFTPGKSGTGRFYVYLTVEGSGDNPLQSRIREYTVSAGNPNVASTGSLKEVLRWDQTNAYHNGGWIGFNPQELEGFDEDADEGSYLYIMSGDGGEGGAQGDPGNHAQDITNNRLGKALRIDVDGDDFPGTAGNNEDKNYKIPPANPYVGITGDDEIWAYGLRNPWRASFDRKTGDLWIGDVGLNNKEEIDFEANAGPGGANYGWRIMEGTNHRLDDDPVPSDYVGPIYDYNHGDDDEYDPLEGNAVIGGYVYRGLDVDLYGEYVFGDTWSNHFWKFDPDAPYSSVEQINDLLDPNTSEVEMPVSMGEDAMGNLYIVDWTDWGSNDGEIFRIATDNNVLPGDYNDDDIVDNDDFEFWRDNYGTANLDADGNGDGRVGAADFTIWRDHWGARDIMAGAGSGANATVPEPATVVLAGMLAAMLLPRRLLPRSSR